jgi:beta-lactamase regulating signal transducer with metallopeptidase domain
MTETGLLLLAWWLTAWVHGCLMLLLVYLGERLTLFKAPSLREAAWRLALLAPLLTASVQMLAVDHPWAGRMALAVSSDLPSSSGQVVASAPLPHARSAQSVVTLSAETGRASISPGVNQGSPTDRSGVAAPLIETRGAATVAAGLGWIWSSLALLLLFRLGWIWRLEHQRVAQLADVGDAEIVAEKQALERLAGLPSVGLVLDPHLASPVALPHGLICLPPWALTRLQPAQRRAMLAHEMAHLRRRDCYWQCAAVLATQLLPRPLGTLARRRLAELAEFACDGWAAQYSGSGRALAESLALCAEFGFAGRQPSILAAAMAQPHSILIERVHRLTKEHAMGFEPLSVVRQSALAMALLAACFALPGVGLTEAIAAPLIADAPEPPTPPAAPRPPVAPAAPKAPIAPAIKVPEAPTPPAPPAAPVAPVPPEVSATRLLKAPTPPTPPAAPVAPTLPTPPAGRVSEAPDAPVAPTAPVAPVAPTAPPPPPPPPPPSEDRLEARQRAVSTAPQLRKLMEPDIFESHFITDAVGDDC